MEKIKIYAAFDCGFFGRTIYCPENNPKKGVRIGCSFYPTIESAIEKIREEYDVVEEAEQYIQKVKDCLEGQVLSIEDENPEVRRLIAMFGTDGHRTVLLKDPNWRVRIEIAVYGSDKHRDSLIKDPEWIVRVAIAEHGNNTHRKILISDPYWRVSEAAEDYMTTK